MCERSDKLIAWLDRELPQQEAADLQQHLDACADCRRCLAAYQQLDKTIVEYCDAKLESPSHHALPFWASAVSAAAAIAVALLFLIHSNPDRRPVLTVAPATTSAANVSAPRESAQPRAAMLHKEMPTRKPRTITPAPAPDAVRPQPAQPAHVQNVSWIPAEPAVQIAIPADAMFAPGAVPQGVSFTADLTIAADGSARELRLRP